ncbi:MAG: epimerase [Bacteroidetes bacterium MedPE-SWsnd-G1]|nr:MAG: epimerase [Bacteroidetes bacterium MedPE-SWsnd-G1]
MGKKVIITGASGMVGKGVLLECLESDLIDSVLVINRNPLNLKHSKLKEVLLKDFTKVQDIKKTLNGYDACFFCMGISSIGISETDFNAITFEPVKAFTDVLYTVNPKLVFNYVSGTGTDSSETSKTMWARVKGKTENYILNKGFKDAYAFRPNMIIPEKGIKSKTGWYNSIYVLLRPFFPLLKKSKNITTTTRLGQAMINSIIHPIELKHLENKDINQLSNISTVN